MTPNELYDLCDEHFDDWILADQEGEIVIYTGLRFKDGKVVKKHHIESNIYGGRNNNINVTTCVSRVKVPRSK